VISITVPPWPRNRVSASQAAAVAAMRSDPRMVAYFPKLATLASFDSIVGEVAYAAKA